MRPSTPAFLKTLACLLCCVPAWAAAPSSSPQGTAAPPAQRALANAEKAYSRGLAALNANNLQAAENAFNECLTIDPKFLGAALGMADVAARRGQLEDVKDWLQKAQAIKPNSVEVVNAWARYYFAKRDYPRAEKLLLLAIQTDPKAFLPRIDLADLYLNQMGKVRQAIEAYREAVRLRPDHAGAHFGLGSAHVAAREYDKALAEFQLAAQSDPANPLPWRAIGQAQASQGRLQEALEAYSSGLKLKPDFAQLYMDRGDVYDALGDTEKAIKDYDTAAAQKPPVADALVRKGMVLQKSNKLDDALEAYRGAIALDPKLATAYNNAAWIAASRGVRLDEALEWAKQAVKLAPREPRYLDTLGWVFRTRKQLDEAVRVFQAGIALAPRDAELHYHLGVVYTDQNKKQEAIRLFKRAIEVDGKSPHAAEAKKRLQELGG